MNDKTRNEKRISMISDFEISKVPTMDIENEASLTKKKDSNHLDLTRQEALEQLDTSSDEVNDSSEHELSDEEINRKNWYEVLEELKNPWDPKDIVSEENLEKMLIAFEGIWNTKNKTLEQIITLTKKNLEIDSKHELSITEVEKIEEDCYVLHLQYLYLKFQGMGFLSNNHQKSNVYILRFQNLFDIQYHTYKLLYTSVRLKQLSDNPQESIASNYGLMRFSHRYEFDPKKDHYPTLIMFYLSKLSEKNYRRYGTDIYKAIYTKNNHFTHAWERYKSIKDFVYSEINIDIDGNAFYHALKSGHILEDCVRFLTNFSTTYFPDIVFNRFYISFENGVYYLPTDTFYPYVINDDIQVTSSLKIDKKFQILDKSIVSCNYIPKYFKHYYNIPWKKIRTPGISRILEKQKFDSSVRPWIWALLGRGFYPLKAKNENWQVSVMLLGYAGTGKSSLLGALRKVYPLDKVGILSNNVEKQWALCSIIEKYVVLGLDINYNFKWDQNEFQSCVVGEEVSVPRKHNTPLVVAFQAPIFLASNRMITSWMDNSGSLKRRLIFIPFIIYIPKHESDPHLNQKIDDQMPEFIQKANRCYLEYADTYGKIDIWKVLPNYLIQISNEKIQATHPLQEFLADTDICSLGIQYVNDYTLLEDFKKCFYNYLDLKGKLAHNITWNKEFYDPVFDAHGIKVVQESRVPHGTKKDPIYRKWVTNIWIDPSFISKPSLPDSIPDKKRKDGSSSKPSLPDSIPDKKTKD